MTTDHINQLISVTNMKQYSEVSKGFMVVVWGWGVYGGDVGVWCVLMVELWVTGDGVGVC